MLPVLSSPGTGVPPPSLFPPSLSITHTAKKCFCYLWLTVGRIEAESRRATEIVKGGEASMLAHCFGDNKKKIPWQRFALGFRNSFCAKSRQRIYSKLMKLIF